MEIKDGIPAVYVANAATWRQWLQDHHATQDAVWLIGYKKGSGVPTLPHEDAVREALCFGWIDSKRITRDAQSFYQCFSMRKPQSNWSKVNKARLEAQIAAGKVMPAGWRAVQIAQQNGSWTRMDAIEEGVVPEDVQAAMEAVPEAWRRFQAFAPSARKAMLYQIVQAKGAETRAKRIAEAVAKAAIDVRANTPRRPG